MPFFAIRATLSLIWSLFLTANVVGVLKLGATISDPQTTFTATGKLVAKGSTTISTSTEVAGIARDNVSEEISELQAELAKYKSIVTQMKRRGRGALTAAPAGGSTGATGARAASSNPNPEGDEDLEAWKSDIAARVDQVLGKNPNTNFDFARWTPSAPKPAQQAPAPSSRPVPRPVPAAQSKPGPVTPSRVAKAVAAYRRSTS